MNISLYDATIGDQYRLTNAKVSHRWYMCLQKSFIWCQKCYLV